MEIDNDILECQKYKFVFDRTKDVPHGNKTFFEHLWNTSRIIKNLFPDEEYLIDAGLYHAIYGTCYFNYDSEVTRTEVKELIGDKAEELVYRYCQLENRVQQILEHKFEEPFQKNLYILEYANLLDQLDESTLENLQEIKSRLLHHYGESINSNCFQNKLHVFDDRLGRSVLRNAHYYCLNSNYKLQQYSDRFYHERDLRFSCRLSRGELIDTQLLPALDKICNELGIKLYLNNYYINHYSQICYVNRHTDALVDGYVTILVFCNEYWDETWGGELKIYEEERSSIHKVIDFVPGRIIVFDSRIEHKVLPLTPSAKTDRFSIAIKALTDISHLSESDMGNLIQLGVA